MAHLDFLITSKKPQTNNQRNHKLNQPGYQNITPKRLTIKRRTKLMDHKTKINKLQQIQNQPHHLTNQQTKLKHYQNKHLPRLNTQTIFPITLSLFNISTSLLITFSSPPSPTQKT